MWFDSYNEIDVERETFSFPREGYGYFDYIIASGFCVITEPDRYLANLRSKLTLSETRILGTLDYVDPWYTYNSMVEFPEESRRLEAIAIEYREALSGLFLFANDETGGLVPAGLLRDFARRYFTNASR
jgi:hypothetical protein